MKHLKTIWHWLSQAKNQKTLAWIGGGLVVAAGGLWQAYVHISEKQKEIPPPTISAPNGGIAVGGNVSATAPTGGNAVIATGNVTIGITFDQYEAGLKQKEQEIRAELRQASAADKEKIALLTNQLADIQNKLKNPERALEDYKAKLVQTYNSTLAFLNL